MSKINELIDSCHKGYIEHFEGSLELALLVEDVVSIMQEYAEYYAKRCLQIAAENAEIWDDSSDNKIMSKQSITDIILPKHEH